MPEPTDPLAIEVEVNLGPKGQYGGVRSIVSTKTLIELPVPNPDALAPMVAATVDSLVAVARAKGVMDAPALADPDASGSDDAPDGDPLGVQIAGEDAELDPV